MSKSSIIAIIVVAVVVIGGLIYWFTMQGGAPTYTEPLGQTQQYQGVNPSPTPTPTPAPTPTPTPVAPPPMPTPVLTPNPISATIQNFQFSPSTLTVKKGTKVTWTNNDGASHTVTADQGSGPASSPLGQGDTYSYTFNTVGTFNYHCSIHPSMHGSVVVTQ